jgi:peroxiredoxin
VRLIILALVTCLTVLAVPARAERIGGLPVGDLAPDLPVTPLGGEPAALSALQAGKPMVLVVFRSACSDCQRETKVLNALWPQLDPAKVTLLAVALRDAPATVTSFRDRFAVKYPLAVDREGKLSRPYNIQEVPTVFILDAARTVRYVVHEETVAQLLQKVQTVLGR